MVVLTLYTAAPALGDNSSPVHSLFYALVYLLYLRLTNIFLITHTQQLLLYPASHYSLCVFLVLASVSSLGLELQPVLLLVSALSV